MYLRDAGLISGQISIVFHGSNVTETALVRHLFLTTSAYFKKLSYFFLLDIFGNSDL